MTTSNTGETNGQVTINAANYAAAIIGMAALRTMFRDPASAVPRFAELADLISKDSLSLATLAIGIRPTDVADGYGEWAEFLRSTQSGDCHGRTPCVQNSQRVEPS